MIEQFNRVRTAFARCECKGLIDLDCTTTCRLAIGWPPRLFKPKASKNS
jgi:hypothetical protein